MSWQVRGAMIYRGTGLLCGYAKLDANHSTFKSHPAGRRGGGNTHLLRFLENSEKAAERNDAVFVYLIAHSFRNFSQSFAPRSFQVWSRGQLKWPYLRNKS